MQPIIIETGNSLFIQGAVLQSFLPTLLKLSLSPLQILTQPPKLYLQTFMGDTQFAGF